MQAPDSSSQRDPRASSLLSLLNTSSAQSDRQQQQQPSGPSGPYPITQQAQQSSSTGAQPGDAESNRPTSISVDSLFRNIVPPSAVGPHQQPSPAPSDLSSGQIRVQPQSGFDQGQPNSINSDRQNALLSLLGNVGSPSSDTQTLDPQSLARNEQTMSSHDNAGKILLDQLVAGSGAESQAHSPTNTIPPIGEQYRSPSPASFGSGHRATSPPVRHASPLGQSEPTSIPSPNDVYQSSRFHFVSPFDALSSAPPPPSAPRVRPVPPAIPDPSTSPIRPISPRAPEPISQFPRRHLSPDIQQAGSRGHSDSESQPTLTRPTNPENRNYARNSPDSSLDSTFRPLPFIAPTSARTSPSQYAPPSSPPQRPSAARESSAVGTAEAMLPPSLAAKEQDSSSSGKENRSKREELRPRNLPLPTAPPGQGAKSKRIPPPSGSPTYILDMNSSLQSVSAAPGLTAVTPIALLKLENIYSQGTTIAVSTFIAYAMTRGRVRLIARSNGSRALLHLPASFPNSTSATDMVVNGNLLACVTSDGGLVIWDVPDELDENPPVQLVLHISPTDGAFGLKLVKWHPHQAGTIAVASDREVYVFNVGEARRTFQGEETALSELGKISNLINIPSPLVSFTFDTPQIALATISIDSTISLWSIKDRLPFWSGRVPGEGLPSSIDFLDGGLLVGRKQGTVLQLLPVMSAQVTATIKLTTGTRPTREDDESIFCHVGYDPRIKTLWVAHSARASLFAVRLSFEPPAALPNETDQTRDPPVYTPTIDQIIEFPTPMQCINMAILVSDEYDTSTAVATFAMHQGGVDQINISMDTFEHALAGTPSKLPVATYSNEKDTPKSVASTARRAAVPPTVQPQTAPQRAAATSFPLTDPTRPRSPVSEAEALEAPSKGKGTRVVKTGKGKDGPPKAETKSSTPESKAETSTTDPAGIAKDLRRVEDNLHTRIGKLLSKELDKQQQRIEDLRRADQEADFARQETILKLISTELTKNTTRVVEQAIKSEVQNTVLPALETITKNEIKAALSNQIAKGLADSMKQTLPNEIERLLLRPDVSNHVARTFSSTVTPLVERHVKDSITKTLIPAYQQATTNMQMELAREISSEILNLKKEIVTWQGEAIRGTEAAMRDMEQVIRGLHEQVRALTLQVQSTPQQPPPQHLSSSHRSSPGAIPSQLQQQQHQTSQLLQHPLPHPHLSNSSHLRQGSLAALNASNSLPSLLSQTQLPQNQNPPQSSSYGTQGMWQQSAPQTQYPPPPNPPPQKYQLQGPQLQQPQPQPLPSQLPSLRQPEVAPISQSSRPGGIEDWDDTFLATLGKQDARLLRDLLNRCNPEVIMPTKRELTPLSQAVILTLIHRLSESLVDLSPQDEPFKIGLWWLQRAAYTLNPNDSIIAAYVGPVLTTSQTILSQTAARIPGNPSNNELQSQISQIQRALSVKPT